ncbi:MAG: SdpI family protein [Chloroflexi bacterium]|nr:SdpI family protein [Chloroflexota bacterium]
MSTRTTLIVSVILILAVSVVSAMLYPQLPELVASHWNANNQVDGYMSRFWGAFLMPVVSVGMLALFLLIPTIDPLKANVAKFRGYFNTFILLLLVFLFYIHGLTLAWNLGHTSFDMGTAMLPALGLFFIYLGIMMKKAKRNWFIGIRTPWTLSSDAVWNETHRLGSTLYIASGILALVGVFFAPYALWFVMAPLLGSSLFLVVYSYVLYQRETKTD